MRSSFINLMNDCSFWLFGVLKVILFLSCALVLLIVKLFELVTIIWFSNVLINFSVYGALKIEFSWLDWIVSLPVLLRVFRGGVYECLGEWLVLVYQNSNHLTGRDQGCQKIRQYQSQFHITFIYLSCKGSRSHIPQV